MIEDRAASLNRFLQAYQQLTRLPAPTLGRVELGELLRRVVHLETRMAVGLEDGPVLTMMADADQLQQAADQPGEECGGGGDECGLRDGSRRC